MKGFYVFFLLKADIKRPKITMISSISRLVNKPLDIMAAPSYAEVPRVTAIEAGDVAPTTPVSKGMNAAGSSMYANIPLFG